MQTASMQKHRVKDIIVISDTHFGSTLSICPPRFRLDDGGCYTSSPLQKVLWAYWLDFWKWADDRLKGAPHILVHNGDVLDGVHHKTTTLVSHNLKDQERMSVQCLLPRANKAVRYYQIRGTEAHVGQSADSEERIAAALNADVDPDTQQHSRWELTMKLGKELLHFSHHIGTTSSTAYESSAPMREIAASFIEAGQWGEQSPTILIRSHRHRYIEVKPANCRIVVTPAWQSKTPFVFKMDRMRAPMFGGLIIRLGDEGVHIRERIYTLKRKVDVVL